MSSIVQDCPVCKKPYSYERRKTNNLHTDMDICLPCDKDFYEAQENYRKWGLKIGRDKGGELK